MQEVDGIISVFYKKNSIEFVFDGVFYIVIVYS